MQAQSQSLDRISALPQDTIEHILSLIPLKYAVRTSILSRKWRYSWRNMPKLVFDDEFVNVFFDSDGEIDKYKFVSAIFHVLLFHKGPISELCILFPDTEIFDEIVNEIDPIILHLSWSKNIKKFIFDVTSVNEYYKLPHTFFSLKGLEHLSLKNCNFVLPLMFNGFSMLKSLVFYDVEITANTLLRFLTSCTLLEEFTLIGIHYDMELSECEFVELCKCLPSVQFLEISTLYIKHLAAGGMPHKLPFSLPNLRRLVLEVCFLELSTVLCVISSSPNLEKIKLELCWNHDRRCLKQTFENLPCIQDYSGLNLGHLKELEIIRFHNYDLEMEFVKLIMAKSPVLKKTRIELRPEVSVDEENKMLRDIVYLPLPRASPAGKFIIQRSKKLTFECN